MKKITFLLALVLLLSGCATYKFQHGAAPYEKGYVVSRDGDSIPDYTIGKNNTVPTDLALAKKRFKQRRDKVEYYYKQMELIERPVKVLLKPAILMIKLLTGVLRLPFVAYTNYKYEHDPKYKAEVDKLDQEKDAKQRQRRNAFKEQLNAYIQKELEKEPAFVAEAQEEPQVNKKVTVSAVTAPQVPEEKTGLEKPSEYSLSQKPLEELTSAIEPPQEVPAATEQISLPPAAQQKEPVISEGIKAVITARPVKGYSPLKVKFSASQSHSKHGRIISYSWDFGDGDTSDKPASANIYWSATYGVRTFTVTLTVRDIKGNTATQTAVIEVLNK